MYVIILGLLSARHMEAFYSMCYNLVVSGIVLASTYRQCILKLSYHSLIASGVFIPGCFCAQANFIELQHSPSLVFISYNYGSDFKWVAWRIS